MFDRALHAGPEHLSQIVARNPTRWDVKSVGFGAELGIERQGDLSLAHEIIWCDVAVSSTGLTKYELAVLGAPAVFLSIDEHHHTVNRAFREVGTGIDLGVHDRVSDGQLRETLADLPRTYRAGDRMWGEFAYDLVPIHNGSESWPIPLDVVREGDNIAGGAVVASLTAASIRARIIRRATVI